MILEFKNHFFPPWNNKNLRIKTLIYINFCGTTEKHTVLEYEMNWKMFGLDNTLYIPIGKSWKSYGVYENFSKRYYISC